MNTVNSDKIVTDEVVMVATAPFGIEQVQVRPIKTINFVAKLADSYMEKMITSSYYHMESDAGGMTSKELATRACDLAEAMWREFESRDWVLDVPVAIQHASAHGDSAGNVVVHVHDSDGDQHEVVFGVSSGPLEEQAETEPNKEPVEDEKYDDSVEGDDTDEGEDKDAPRDEEHVAPSSDVGVVERTGANVQEYIHQQERYYADQDAETLANIQSPPPERAPGASSALLDDQGMHP